MNDLTHEDIGGKSQTQPNTALDAEMAQRKDASQLENSQTEGTANTLPQGREIWQTEEGLSKLPDIISENDVARIPKGEKFLARFINDPKGDTGRYAKDNLPLLRSGKIIRNGLSPAYWAENGLKRPPVGESLGGGKYRLLEAGTPTAST